MAIQKTEAFVLKTQTLRTSSLIVTFFTRDYGKLRGIAKGVRREREIRGAFYELFTHLEIIFYEKIRSELHLISEAAIIDSHDGLRKKLDTIVYASYFVDLVDHLTEVHDPHEGIYDLLEFSMRFLAAVPCEKIARIFEVKLLREIGWLPFLEGCLECGNSILIDPYFSIKQGGIYCQNCHAQFPDARGISPESLNVLRYFVSHSPEDCLKRHVSGPAAEELEKLMNYFLLYRLGTPLSSRKFLETLKPQLSS